jgi:hypothetical protein
LYSPRPKPWRSITTRLRKISSPRIKAGQCFAFLRSNELFDYRETLCSQIIRYPFPIEGLYTVAMADVISCTFLFSSFIVFTPATPLPVSLSFSQNRAFAIRGFPRLCLL